MRFSVVIPTFERNDLLGKCLERLAPGRQTLAPEQYEVIITDDSPRCTAREFVEQNFPWAQWVQGPAKGPASNRNSGAKAARGEWLVFLDDDCLPDEALLEAYNLVIESDPTVCVLEGKIQPDGKPSGPLDYAPVNEQGGHLWSCNFAITKTCFQQLGGFDEHFRYPHLEDNDLSIRVRELGFAHVFVAKALVKHPWRQIRDGKKLGRYQEMYVYFMEKHRRKYSLRGLLTSICRVHLAMLKRAAFSPQLFLSLKVMFDHMFTVVKNYHGWREKYVGHGKP